MPGWRWDVALLFAGAQRDYAGQVAQVLKARGCACFYDADRQVRLRGLEQQRSGRWRERAEGRWVTSAGLCCGAHVVTCGYDGSSWIWPVFRALGHFMGSGYVRWSRSVQQGHFP